MIKPECLISFQIIIIDIAVTLRYNGGEVIMMPNTTYNIRIDKQVREQADALYKSMGLSLSSAINLFLRQSLIQGKLPINEVIAVPAYADMLLRDAAEIDAAIADGTAKVYDSLDELFASWRNDDD
jgi:DNA-damage-inducible protein J